MPVDAGAELTAELNRIKPIMREQAAEIERLDARVAELEAEAARDYQAYEQQEARHLENVAKWRARITDLEEQILVALGERRR